MCVANDCGFDVTDVENGDFGNCTYDGSMPSGDSCEYTCDDGYTVTGPTSCYAGTLTVGECLGM